MKFNPETIQFKVPKVIYMGTEITKDGMRPSRSKEGRSSHKDAQTCEQARIAKFGWYGQVCTVKFEILMWK